MVGNLTAILPGDLSFSGLAGVSYVKLVAALVAFLVVAIVLNVLSQLVRVLHPGHWSLSDVPFSSFYLATRVSLRLFFIGYPFWAPLSSTELIPWDSLTVAARRLAVTNL